MQSKDDALLLLTNRERALVEDGKLPPTGFVEDFTKWAARKTDAPAYTLNAAGLMALSLAAGDVVVLDGLFSSQPIYLNLYVLIVGPSTVLRKSTVLNYITDLMPTTVQGNNLVTVLDDVSPQALNKTLAAAGSAKRPVLMNLDEVAGIFEVQKRTGSYLKGFDKILMKAYDHSPIHVLRASASIDVPNGAFVSVLSASTPDPLFAVLEAEDVESGLLPRFLIFDARYAQRGVRRTLMDRSEDQSWAADKGALSKHLSDIAAGALTMQNAQPTKLKISEDALRRMDVLDQVIYQEAGADTTALGAMKGRAFWHVVKLAGLYALSRAGRHATVELHDVYRAMHLVEETLADLHKMTEEVGNNKFERRAQEVLEMLEANGGTMAQAQVTSQLKLEWREAADILRTLEMRGRMVVDKTSKQWRVT